MTNAFLDAFQLETLDELPELPEHQQDDDLFHEE